jgi:hypothetical protein
MLKFGLQVVPAVKRPVAAIPEKISAARLWAKGDNPFWSNHVAAWYRGTLEAETWCRKHDLSTTDLMRWARHLQSEDLRRRTEHLRNLPQNASIAWNNAATK